MARLVHQLGGRNLKTRRANVPAERSPLRIAAGGDEVFIPTRGDEHSRYFGVSPPPDG